MMAEMELLVERTMRQQQEQLGANLSLVSMNQCVDQTVLCFDTQVNVGLKRTAECQQAHTDFLHR